MINGLHWLKTLLYAGIVPAVLLTGLSAVSQAQMVPGTGTLHNTDDFEDEDWGYVFNLPKSSKEEDETIRYPLGGSTNGRWIESPKRGQPDVVKRVATPAGGLEDSEGALMLQTRDTGIPGRPMGKQCQDDFILKARPLAVGYSPNFVVRIFLPEWNKWEQRNGVSFGIRAGMQGPQETWEDAGFTRRLFGQRKKLVTKNEPFYPGFFIQFNPQTAQNPEPHALILVRANENGQDIPSRTITQTGWWTFGMSVTPDGRCHYYAKAGVEDLTAADFITSTLPYSIRGNVFNTIFFNVCSADNGQSWSTPWIIDDPKIYHSGRQNTQFAQPRQRTFRR